MEHFMQLRRLFFAFLLSTFAFLLSTCSARPIPSMAVNRQNCPITKPSDRPFVPPAPYSSSVGSDEFFYGTSALWTVVERQWQLHGFAGQKLPYFRQGYDELKETARPRLTVVARRLDGKAPLVWNGLAGSGSTGGWSFMVTGIDIPSPGCWEIGAQYVDTSHDIHTVQTLSYTVWVEP
jgi:hypothetical protein